MSQKVGVLGASAKEGRYARLAQELLLAHGYSVIPIHPKSTEILGITAYSDLLKAPDCDTVTIYIGKDLVRKNIDQLLNCSASRFIFNPGTECVESMGRLQDAGKTVLEACTLVLLKTGQFDHDF
jgi:predicted CoA-binding protein